VELIIPAASDVKSIAVLTQGNEGLDFAMAPDSTCKTERYAKVSKCIVNVTFTPAAPGLRMGAVVLFSGPHNTGRQVASWLISGIGTGPQVAFNIPPGNYPESFSTVPLKWSAPKVDGLSLNWPSGLAMDGSGDLFIADMMNNRVVEIPAGGGSASAFDPTVSGESLNQPQGLALNGAGDLFVLHANQANTEARLFEVPSGSGPAISLNLVVGGVPVGIASGLAVDGQGNLFIADYNNARIVKIPENGGAAVALGWTVDGVTVDPQGVAVDAAGDLILADYDNVPPFGLVGRVVKVPGDGGAPFMVSQFVHGDYFQFCQMPQVIVDAADDIYVPDTCINEGPPWFAGIVVPVSGQTPFYLDLTGFPPGDMDQPLGAGGLVLDREGNLFVTQVYGYIVEFQQTKPLTLKFPTPTAVGDLDTSDPMRTVTIQNIGNKNLDLSDVDFPADFSSFGGGTGACTGETAVEPGDACNISIGFTPKHVGILKEFVTPKDNNLNKSDAKQQIPVEGKGIR
jgi:hypothetical protein